MKIEEKGLVHAPALNFCRAQQPADRRAIVGGARRARARKRRLLSAARHSTAYPLIGRTGNCRITMDDWKDPSGEQHSYRCIDPLPDQILIGFKVEKI